MANRPIPKVVKDFINCPTPRPERDVQRAIKDWLMVQGYKAIRLNNQGTFRTVKGRSFYTFHGEEGLPDLLVIGHGRVFFVEGKSAKGKQTPGQKRFEKSLIGTDVAYILARCIDDVKNSLDLLNGDVF